MNMRIQGFTGVYMGVHENTGVYSSTRVYMRIQGFTQQYRGLQENTWVYSSTQGCT